MSASLGYPPINNSATVRPTVRASMYEPQYNAPHWANMDVRGRYWENMMGSRYAVDVQRIYGVPGSEFVGYGPNDLNINNPNPARMHGSPIGPSMADYEVPIEVSSTASSTEMNHTSEMGGNLTTSAQPVSEVQYCLRKVFIMLLFHSLLFNR